MEAGKTKVTSVFLSVVFIKSLLEKSTMNLLQGEGKNM
jgi:hypothetical protein